MAAEWRGLRKRPTGDFNAVLNHIREIRAELARLASRVDGIEARGVAAGRLPADGLLHDAIAQAFSLGELRSLAFGLEVDAEELNGEGLSDQALALVLYMRRRGRLGALLKELQAQRPHVKWNTYI